jgi:methionyl aminopeptidase
MKIHIFTEPELTLLKRGIEIHKKIEDSVKSLFVEGSSPFEINRFVESLCKKYKVKSAFYGQVNQFGMPFPAECCVLVNEEIVHSIPFSRKPFKTNDLVKFDFGIIYEGFYTDFGFTILIGDSNQNTTQDIKVQIRQNLKNAVEKSIYEAASVIKNGITSGNISSVLQNVTLNFGFLPVHMFCGHGIGKKLHLDPQIPFWGEQNTGQKVLEGMVLCVENWIAEKNNEVVLEKDNWTYKLKDGGCSAFKECMILVSKNGAQILSE